MLTATSEMKIGVSSMPGYDFGQNSNWIRPKE